MTRPVLRAVTPYATDGVTSGTTPSGTLAGDTVVAVQEVDFRSTGDFVAPTGGITDWQPLTAAIEFGDVILRAWIGHAPSNGAKTVTVSQGGGNSGNHLILRTYQGAVELDGTVTSAGGTANATTLSVAQVDPATSDAILLGYWAGGGFSPNPTPTSPVTITPPASMPNSRATARFNEFFGLFTGSQDLTSDAATGSRAATTSTTTSAGWVGVVFALKGAVTSATVQATATVTGGMTMTAGGTATPAVQASAATTGGLAISAGAVTNTDVKATAPVTGTLAVAAGGSLVGRVSAAVTSSLAVDAAPAGTFGVAAGVTGLLTFAAAAVPARAATAVLTGDLTVSLSPSRGQPVTAAVTGTLALGATPGQAGTAAVTGALDITASSKLDQAATSDVGGDLDVTIGYPYQGYATSAAVTAVLDVTSSASRDRRDTTVPVTGALTVTAAGVRAVTPNAAVSGSLTVEVTNVIRAVRPTTTLLGALSIEALAVSSAGGALNVKLFAIDRQNGDALVPLPHWSKLDVSRQINGAGSIAVDYPVWGRNFWILQRDVAKDSDLEVEVWLGGRRSSRVVGYLQQPNGDDIAEAAVWSFTGVDTCGRPDELIVYPQAAVGVADLGSEVAVPQSTVTTAQWTQLLSLGYTGRVGDTVPTVYVPQLVLNAVKAGSTIPVKADDQRELKFNAASPGAVMNIVLSQARARGATDLKMDFTAAKDSNDTPWPELVTAKWSPGTTVASILSRLVDLGLIDWDITADKVLRLYVQGTSGALYTSGQSAVRLRRGVNLAQATHRASARENLSAVLAAGSGGLYSDVTNTSAQARIGRRKEGYTTAGNIVDNDALLNVAQRTATLGANGPDERTFAIAMGTGNPRPGPGQTFDKADTLMLDTTGTGAWIEARVAQWTISVGPAGASGNVVVGDRISSRAAAILKRLTDTGDGSTVIGTSTTSVDTGIPRAPDGLVVGSAAFAGGSSGADEYATVTAGWQAVVYNTDNSACTDLAGYRVEWRQDGTEPWLFGADVPSGTTQGSWTTQCDIPIYARVRAYDTSGNSSIWTTLAAPHTTDSDTTPPGVPSTPIGGNYLGTVQATWDGRDSNNADMYAAWPDFKVAHLHMSQAAEFVPDDSTQIDMIYGAGTYTYAKLPSGGSLSYGTTYYFKLVAEDQRGNLSAPSGQTSAAAGKVVNIDLGPDAVARANIQVAAIGTAQIDNLAVNDAQIGNVSVGKLQAGTLTASMIVGTGKISTRAGGTGAGWDGDSAGIRLYGPTGDITVNLQTATGSAMVSGEYRTTNASTARMVINPGGGAPAEMRFYPSSTNQFGLMRPLTSVAIGYENQAGVGLKAYSARPDKQSGEVSAFPGFASLVWGNEQANGAITSRVAATNIDVYIAGPRTRIAGKIGQSDAIKFNLIDSNGDIVGQSSLKLGDGGSYGLAQLLSDSPNGNSGIQFNDAQGGYHGISVIAQGGGLVDCYARAFKTSSARRLKTGIERAPIDVAAAVKKIGLYRYTFTDQQGPPSKQVGLMADELPPDLVSSDHNGDQVVDVYGIAAMAVAGLRDVIGRVEQLENRSKS